MNTNAMGESQLRCNNFPSSWRRVCAKLTTPNLMGMFGEGIPKQCWVGRAVPGTTLLAAS
jgi:hypothetical protein